MKNMTYIYLWIEQNLNIKITLADLALKSGYSQRYLNSLFREQTGMSPGQYIRNRKLTQAAFMLRDSSRSITDISLMYGFENLSSFSRSFKLFSYKTPRRYRQSSSWNMEAYCPSATLRETKCNVKFLHIKDTLINITHRNTLKVNFGINFHLSTTDGRYYPPGNTHSHFMQFIFSKKTENGFVVGGEVKPGQDCDTVITAYKGNFNHIINNKTDTVTISDGIYICFIFKGRPHELMAYQAWARGHGLHKYGVSLKRGPTFTYYEPIPDTNIYECHHFFPCNQNL
ncbi:helix-turn-helix transcriptional regulator [Salmonella enterica]|nr:helix-turn-helix transcriptional regulator [Salmonella enterica]EDQ7953508.1 helix-turn-helix transcriptional regulator [Salmonella enterica subsp. enterica serovar Oslo]EGS9941579.1 helix-turn-helix transcriptional regulator [Salmonella enterica]EHG2547260.1 helix-turn-helix transcriptional regulator [Salmonella enterica]